jgi:hypothetical protein
MIRHLTLLGLLLAGAALPNPAAAREPNRDEAAAIAQALGAAGYRDWRKVELDDGIWEVDDAANAEGTRRDLRLTPGTYRIIARDTESRLANTPETARVMEALRQQGFTDPGEVKLDDGLWKVDNARMADGSRHDLVLERESLRILHREREG